MEELGVLYVMAVDELLVREQVPVRMDDSLGQAGRAARVVELRRVVGGGVDDLPKTLTGKIRRIELRQAELGRSRASLG